MVTIPITAAQSEKIERPLNADIVKLPMAGLSSVLEKPAVGWSSHSWRARF